MSMKCRYIYKGQVFESEAALDDFLIEIYHKGQDENNFNRAQNKQCINARKLLRGVTPDGATSK